MTSYFIDGARTGNNSPGAYIATIALVFGVTFLAGSVPALLYFQLKGIQTHPELFETTSSSVALCLLLCGFVLGCFTLLGCVKLFHRRSPLTLIRPERKIRWNLFFFSFFLAFLLSAGADIVLWFLEPEEFTWQFNPAGFFPFFLVAIGLFPFQIALEELLFRGYLMQGIGIFTRGNLIPLILTSLLFGLMHMANEEVAAFGTGKMLFVYSFSGLMLGVLTLMSGGLELALGFHLMNNLYAALIHTFPSSSLPTPALFSTPDPGTGEVLWSTIIGAVIFVGLTGLVYKWRHWRVLLR